MKTRSLSRRLRVHNLTTVLRQYPPQSSVESRVNTYPGCSSSLGDNAPTLPCRLPFLHRLLKPLWQPWPPSHVNPYPLRPKYSPSPLSRRWTLKGTDDMERTGPPCAGSWTREVAIRFVARSEEYKITFVARPESIYWAAYWLTWDQRLHSNQSCVESSSGLNISSSRTSPRPSSVADRSHPGRTPCYLEASKCCAIGLLEHGIRGPTPVLCNHKA